MPENDLLELIKTLHATQATQNNELRRLNIIIERLSTNQKILIEERKEDKAEYIRQLTEKEKGLNSRLDEIEENTRDLEKWVDKAKARISLIVAVSIIAIPLIFSLWQSGR
ncbi:MULTISPECIES: hypothetical protein [unclassified Roseofilum]|uniref:hypothetical protein n=1 Tax=unclassified Roseofilum TaxID=2620099 RepID=UPI000E843C56|nr:MULTISPECIES: hypothetical protein [unclassified Roseofilum]MBP0011332.1 hypothetical protein [Roseofilum sp. Belize Diploria]MBP0033603.1 hypothetical protein [Roseofilum sp. Belize BBD 4]HBQ97391.1 hypothetical protein [Cyanobacteria bacterium UBA11691]